MPTGIGNDSYISYIGEVGHDYAIIGCNHEETQCVLCVFLYTWLLCGIYIFQWPNGPITEKTSREIILVEHGS